MKLAYPALNGAISFEENKIAVLVVESPILFRNMIIDLSRQVAGGSGDFVLSKDSVPIPINKEVELIQNPLFPNFEQRRIINKLISELEREALSESFFLDTRAIQTELAAYLENLLAQSNAPLVCDSEISISSLLKAANIRIDYDEESPVERLCEYLDVISALHLAKCFVFVSLKSFLTQDELRLLYSSVAYKKYNLLLLENSMRDGLREVEKTILLDKDLCEVINEYK